jgi:hypothetical protein
MVTPFIEALVDDEIRRLVAEAIAKNSTISTTECVAEVKRVYPTCGLSKRYLGDRVLMTAAAAGVPVEIGASKKPALAATDAKTLSSTTVDNAS